MPSRVRSIVFVKCAKYLTSGEYLKWTSNTDPWVLNVDFCIFVKVALEIDNEISGDIVPIVRKQLKRQESLEFP